ncbi:MAG: DUF3501 family protein [Gammaproteobacteria bacterium]|nr:DUF3501 family protein [Gammaproteobacteria bacterium]NNF59976.1 DUF3501 family protein [Gammaproteobacteria bacterium]
MNKLQRSDLYTLEAYSQEREGMRAAVMEHKRQRRLALGPLVNLYFEDRLTMHYQVQEMLRAERIFEADAIQEELDAYNPLIPDGTNWKATMMIEVPDPRERARQLASLIGIEDVCYMQVEGCERVYARADEDLERSTAEKTSSVHFMRFELEQAMIERLRGGAALSAGVEHALYNHRVETVPTPLRESLIADLG